MNYSNKNSDLKDFAKSYPALLAALILSTAAFMYTRKDIFYIIFNLLILFFAGRLFSDHASGKRFSVMFVISALASAAVFYLAFGFEQNNIPEIIAASMAGGAISTIVAAAWLLPEYPIRLMLFGKLKLMYIAMIIIGIEYLLKDYKNLGPWIAGLGGIVAATAYVQAFKYRLIISQRIKNTFRRKPKVVYRNPNTKEGNRPLTDDEYNERKAAEQKEIDRILDKIKINGYDSLSTEEKQKLFNASRK